VRREHFVDETHRWRFGAIGGVEQPAADEPTPIVVK
jgi:hypothetical protein